MPSSPRPSGPESPPSATLPASVSGARTSFLVVDHVLFCFIPFTLFPGRLSKATFCHQGTRKGQGLSWHVGFPEPPPPASIWLCVCTRTRACVRARGGGALRYLFIYLLLLCSTPSKLFLPTGEDEKRLQTMEDKACHMAPSV